MIRRDVFTDVFISEKWQLLIPGAHMHMNCEREGFNVVSSSYEQRMSSSRARIGVISSKRSTCDSADWRLGFGTEGRVGRVGRVEEAVVRTTITRAEMNLPLLTDEEREFLLKRSAIF